MGWSIFYFHLKRFEREAAQQRRLQSASLSSADSYPGKEMQCLQTLSNRIIVMILLKFLVHFPIAIFYLLRLQGAEASRPGINLLVLSPYTTRLRFLMR
ncbi:hypothetical protein RvY_06286-2 [Ramazzottius varieornatus]|nr:hypothetical protein RvY_06286-2 [Ramazzottius varieornatus]